MSNTPNQKKRRAERTRQFLETLMERYPRCFTPERQAVHPLAIGIQEAVRDDLKCDAEYADTPNWLIKQALARYTHAPSYLEALIAGRHRIDLQGQPAGEVTDEARAHARTRRDEQKKRAAERRRARNAERGKSPAREQARQRKLEGLAHKFNEQ